MERRLTEGEEVALREHLERAAVRLYLGQNNNEKYTERAFCHPSRMRYFGGRGAKVIVTPVGNLSHYYLLDIYPHEKSEDGVLSVHPRCREGLNLPTPSNDLPWEAFLVFIEEAKFYDRGGRYKPRDDPTEGMPIGGMRINVTPAKPDRTDEPVEERRAPLPTIPAR